jgi:hypothetical protein
MPAFGTERRKGNKGINGTNKTNVKKIRVIQTKPNKAWLKQVRKNT